MKIYLAGQNQKSQIILTGGVKKNSMTIFLAGEHSVKNGEWRMENGEWRMGQPLFFGKLFLRKD